MDFQNNREDRQVDWTRVHKKFNRYSTKREKREKWNCMEAQNEPQEFSSSELSGTDDDGDMSVDYDINWNYENPIEEDRSSNGFTVRSEQKDGIMVEPRYEVLHVLNRSCLRFGKNQLNMAGCTKVVTFSLRQQLREILESGNYNREILDRNLNETSLSERLSKTPNYIQRLAKATREHPDIETMFLTINMDGFRKRGLSRGDFWPLYVAANDLSDRKSAFSEYRPEVVMLSSLIQTSKTMENKDFNSAFERLRLEIEETQRNPINITINGVNHKIRLEIYRTVLDMDASRKIHGLPVWQAYSGCSRCTIKGKRIETRKGSKLVWVPEGIIYEYSSSRLPEKLKSTCLPPPWEEGFDSLHLINEGTSRDVLKDLLKGGRKYSTKISQSKKSEWTICLNNAKNPKGVSSNIMLDPIQLSTRTGSEVQQLFNISVPTELAPLLRKLLATHFPEYYTMKQHFVLDHMIQNLNSDGTPLLSSAGPFERLNQVLGRSTGSFTTRTVLNMCKRFISLQKAVSYCSAAVKKENSPMRFPASMRAVDIDETTTTIKTDDRPFLKEEDVYLKNKFKETDLTEFRTATRVGKKVYSTRMSCENSVQHTCFVVFVNEEGKIRFASIERIFFVQNEEMVLARVFQTENPFHSLYRWCEQFTQLRSSVEICKKANTYFKQVVHMEYETFISSKIIDYCIILEANSKSYVSRL
ncbi:hypothetical protein CAEBREN_10631 [Caenorhabditis brenneri]|uniref:Uncharacterized protein n=1 Tax=Caenorhabditis brenneri TaxID=135651 RepID=G0PI93_CAEBE|nr:hypothetical protein CAEBREN_10631 [Caenorhabditis brenneri]